ncbi:hypothetical protein MXB_3510, partial [Myxobolus squamalis]
MSDAFLPTQANQASNFGPLQPHFSKCKSDIEAKYLCFFSISQDYRIFQGITFQIKKLLHIDPNYQL